MGTKAAINLSIILAIVALTVPALSAVVSAGETAQQQLSQTVDNTAKFDGGPTGDDPAWRGGPPRGSGLRLSLNTSTSTVCHRWQSQLEGGAIPNISNGPKATVLDSKSSTEDCITSDEALKLWNKHTWDRKMA